MIQDNNQLSSVPVFQTRDGIQVQAMDVNGTLKFFTPNKDAVYAALEEDLKSLNFYDRKNAASMIEIFERFGLEQE